jgi:hypothetical protein
MTLELAELSAHLRLKKRTQDRQRQYFVTGTNLNQPVDFGRFPGAR